MGQGEKRLEQMRANPLAGWTIDDVRVVCDGHNVSFLKPKSGSHYKVTHQSQHDILTVPYNRPIKAVYIRRLVKFIDAVKDTDP